MILGSVYVSRQDGLISITTLNMNRDDIREIFDPVSYCSE